MGQSYEQQKYSAIIISQSILLSLVMEFTCTMGPGNKNNQKQAIKENIQKPGNELPPSQTELQEEKQNKDHRPGKAR